MRTPATYNDGHTFVYFRLSGYLLLLWCYKKDHAMSLCLCQKIALPMLSFDKCGHNFWEAISARNAKVRYALMLVVSSAV